jgi:hypothetical protein
MHVRAKVDQDMMWVCSDTKREEEAIAEAGAVHANSYRAGHG